MADEAMTKRQAAALWSQTYGPARKYSDKIKAANRLSFSQMSRLWNELYDNEHYDCKDIETGFRFTLLSWLHPKLGKNVLTLAVILRKGNQTASSVMTPLSMTEIGENKGGLWQTPTAPSVIIVS
jgi:hypothetical protein